MFSLGHVQDDSLYEQLTVRENFIFSGMFQLPEGTPMIEIEDLADATMANLDLCRIMHNLVGEKSCQRALSEVQKKRVSIGVEAMARPRILFVEGPTDKLDPASSLLIVRSLKKLVDNQGLTVVTTLNDSRRDAFELFDSLTLLGLGGKLVYHGKINKIGKYFNHLNYYLAAGDSLTDWLLDICSGRLPPPVRRGKGKGKSKKSKLSPPLSPGSDTDSRGTKTTAESSTGEKPRVKRVTFAIQERTPSGSDEKENLAGHKTKPFDRVTEQAKATCEVLHEHWVLHMKELPRKKRARYEAPSAYPLPRNKERPPLFHQLGCQLQRLLILMERNWFSTFLDTAILVVAVTLITFMDGAARPTMDWAEARTLNYYNIVEPDTLEAIFRELPSLFAYALDGIKGDIES